MAECGTDYDLAILGGALSSRLAAYSAARRGARVALVAPNFQMSDAAQAILQVLSASKSMSDLQIVWPHLSDWIRYQGEHGRFSPTALQSSGIDVILEPATFTQSRCLRLKNRHLKASHYLLTDGYDTSFAQSDDDLMCHQLTRLNIIPERIAVVGDGATAAEWAYALSQVTTVTLISSFDRLLPAEDTDIQRLSEAQFESLGINVVYSPSSVQSRNSEGWARQITHDLVITIPQACVWHSTGLENLNIPIAMPIAVNRYLQTNCSQVYVSGSSLGGEHRAELTQQETIIALDNALWGRRLMVNYGRACYSIHLLSPIGRWGLTERQARQRYGDDVDIFQASCLPVCAEHSAQVNFCKLIVLGTQVIGIHLMGEGASTLVSVLGPMPNMHMLNQWAEENFAPGSLQDAIYQATEQWESCLWEEGKWRRDWAENWFNWRRSRW